MSVHELESKLELELEPKLELAPKLELEPTTSNNILWVVCHDGNDFTTIDMKCYNDKQENIVNMGFNEKNTILYITKCLTSNYDFINITGNEPDVIETILNNFNQQNHLICDYQHAYIDLNLNKNTDLLEPQVVDGCNIYYSHYIVNVSYASYTFFGCSIIDSNIWVTLFNDDTKYKIVMNKNLNNDDMDVIDSIQKKVPCIIKISSKRFNVLIKNEYFMRQYRITKIAEVPYFSDAFRYCILDKKDTMIKKAISI